MSKPWSMRYYMPLPTVIGMGGHAVRWPMRVKPWTSLEPLGKRYAAFFCDRKVVVCESGISGGRHVGNARTRVRDEGNVLMTLSSSWI